MNIDQLLNSLGGYFQSSGGGFMPAAKPAIDYQALAQIFADAGSGIQGSGAFANVMRGVSGLGSGYYGMKGAEQAKKGEGANLDALAEILSGDGELTPDQIRAALAAGMKPGEIRKMTEPGKLQEIVNDDGEIVWGTPEAGRPHPSSLKKKLSGDGGSATDDLSGDIAALFGEGDASTSVAGGPAPAPGRTVDTAAAPAVSAAARAAPKPATNTEISRPAQADAVQQGGTLGVAPTSPTIMESFGEIGRFFEDSFSQGYGGETDQDGFVSDLTQHKVGETFQGPDGKTYKRVADGDDGQPRFVEVRQ